MPEQMPRRVRHGAPIWGVLLVFLGVVFLLQTLDILPWDLWRTLWRFWPALLVVGGINVLVGHRNVWAVSALILAVFCVCLGIAIWQHESSPCIITLT